MEETDALAIEAYKKSQAWEAEAKLYIGRAWR